MRKKKNNHPWLSRNSFFLLARLTQHFITVLLLFCLLLFLLYVMGNFQDFLDTTQLMILKILSVSSVTMCFLAIIGIVEHTVFLFIFPKKGQSIVIITLLLLLLGAGVFFAAYSTVLGDLSSGF